MIKYVPLNKRSKKEREEYYKKMRAWVDFNTGDRKHETDKKPSRARQKQLWRKQKDEY